MAIAACHGPMDSPSYDLRRAAEGRLLREADTDERHQPADGVDGQPLPAHGDRAERESAESGDHPDQRRRRRQAPEGAPQHLPQRAVRAESELAEAPALQPADEQRSGDRRDEGRRLPPDEDRRPPRTVVDVDQVCRRHAELQRPLQYLRDDDEEQEHPERVEPCAAKVRHALYTGWRRRGLL